MPDRPITLQELATGDVETARRLIHTLKSTSATLGALALSSAAMRLEAAIAAGGARPELFDELAVILKTTLSDMRRHLGD